MELITNLVEEEDKMTIMEEEVEEVFSKKKFTHCGKNSHIMDVCYRKHNYPAS